MGTALPADTRSGRGLAAPDGGTAAVVDPTATRGAMGHSAVLAAAVHGPHGKPGRPRYAAPRGRYFQESRVAQRISGPGRCQDEIRRRRAKRNGAARCSVRLKSNDGRPVRKEPRFFLACATATAVLIFGIALMRRESHIVSTLEIRRNSAAVAGRTGVEPVLADTVTLADGADPIRAQSLRRGRRGSGSSIRPPTSCARCSWCAGAGVRPCG